MRCLISLFVGLLFLVPLARAELIEYDNVLVDIELVLGSGEHQTMIIVDWESGESPSHAWLFEWDYVYGDTQDQAPTLADAFDAIAAAVPAFSWNYTDSGWGYFVLSISYDDGEEFHSTPAGHEGWLSFWLMDDYNGLDPSLGWYLASSGVDSTFLSDGGWAAAIADDYPDWGDQPPTIPVPEPVGLLFMASGLLSIRRQITSSI